MILIKYDHLFAMLLTLYGYFLIGPNVANAGAGVSPLVVKVYSSPCQGIGGDYRGSGTLFRVSDSSQDVYVLTSEHVLIQGRSSDGICHKVVFVSQEVHSDVGGLSVDFNAEIVASDWHSGLAVLKLTTPSKVITATGEAVATPSLQSLSSRQVPTIDALIGSEIASETSLNVQGFPFAEEITARSSDGVLASSQSIRHLMPNKNKIYEITGALGEFGMSGGPIWTSQGQIAGILSHQFLKQRAGAAGVANFSDNDSNADDLIGIRGLDAKSWLDQALSGNLRAGFVRDFVDQLDGVDAVYSDGLKFTAIPQKAGCSAEAPNSIGGADGHDPVGVGGHDPIGVGGDSAQAPGSIVVAISRDRETSHRIQATTWSIPKLQDWFKHVNESLQRAESLSSVGLIYRKPGTDGVSLVCARSLEEYFRKVVEDGVMPLTYRQGGAADIQQPVLVKSLIEQSQRALIEASVLHALLEGQGKKSRLIELARFYGSMGASAESWKLLQTADISLLTCVTENVCPYKREWSSLFNDHEQWPRAQRLLQALIGMEKALKILMVGSQLATTTDEGKNL